MHGQVLASSQDRGEKNPECLSRVTYVGDITLMHDVHLPLLREALKKCLDKLAEETAGIRNRRIN